LSALSSDDRRGKDDFPALSPNLDAVSGPNELWSLGSDPLSDKHGMLSGLSLRRTQMPVHILGGYLTRQIKEKSFHNWINRTRIAAFLSDAMLAQV